MNAPSLADNLKTAAATLLAAGVDSPRLDAEVLLAHCLGVQRSYLLAHLERPLPAAGQSSFGALVARRAAREPLAYIIGERWFYGLALAVTPAVLIPRPETELLVEAALNWVRTRRDGACRLVDVGTGCGAIAIAIAVHTDSSAATILATDISAEALTLARRNAERQGVAGRITFLQSDLLASMPQAVDVIVANLPYVAEVDRGSLMPEVRDYEPATALFGGPDGLTQIGRLLAQAPDCVRPGGALFFEIGWNQGASAANLAHRHFPTADATVVPDLAGLDRLLFIQTH